MNMAYCHHGCCHKVSLAGFIFSLTASLLGLFMQFFVTWVHYTSSVEPMDFSFNAVCHRPQDVGNLNHPHHCAYAEFWLYMAKNGYDSGTPTLVLPLTLLQVGLVCSFLCAFLSNPFMCDFKGKIGLKLVTPILSLVSGFNWMFSFSQFCFDYKRHFQLDGDYLHLGNACSWFSKAMVCSFAALTCHTITAYHAHRTQPSSFTWVGQRLHFMWTIVVKKLYHIYPTLDCEACPDRILT